MIIRDIQYERVRIEMDKPFKIALGSTDYYEGFFVKVTTDEDITGFGEAIPTPFITGDTIGSVESELRIFSRELAGDEVSSELLNSKMKAIAKSSKASRAAVDMAVHDLVGKKANMPLHRLLGGYRKSMVTSYTIDLVPAEEAREQAKEHLEAGVRFFKIKLGMSEQADFERVKAVRDTVGPEYPICVDFNQSYSPKDAVRLSDRISEFDIEFIEQPVNKYDIKGLRFTRDHSSIPVMADEAVFSVEDASNVLMNEAADLINIKIMKCGGLTDALKIVKAAETFRIPCMVGCMVETKIANTAGLQFALSQPNVKYTDLDGFSSLKNPPVLGGMEFRNGENYPPEGFGIGAEPTLKFTSGTD